MKKAIAFLLVICLALGMAGVGLAEDAAGTWYMTYAGVTIGELALNADASYATTVYSQEEGNTGTWSQDGVVITLTYSEGMRERYLLDGTELIPVGFSLDFSIRREPGVLTDLQLNDYLDYGTLPEGVSGEDVEAVIRAILEISGGNRQPEPEPEPVPEPEPEPEKEPEPEYSPMFSGEETFESEERSYARGFNIPVVSGWGRPARAEDKASSTIQYQYDTERFACEENCTFVELDSFPDPAEYCLGIRASLLNNGTYPDMEERQLEIGGFPAYAICFGTENEGETAGIVYVVRENTVAATAVVCRAKEGNPVRVMLSDLEKIAEQMTFDPAKAPLRRADGELTLALKNGAEAVSAGKKVTVVAAFANAAAVTKAKAGALAWTLTDRDTGEAPEGITLDENGLLSVTPDLTENRHLEITASSELFGTKATLELLAVPVIRKLAADPAAVTLYTNSDDEAAVTVTADPDIALEGLEWTLKPGNIAEVVTGEGGTAVIKAAAAGKGTLTVKEPGGKTVGVRVTVDVPVESVSLSWSGNAGPGNVVKVSADVQPKNAGNRKVEWSLDVDKEVAAINDYGRLKINRNTPEGTVIVVTCTAPGAKVPIVEKIEIVVGEKK